MMASTLPASTAGHGVAARLLGAGASVFALQGAALALTASGDWGLGWKPVAVRTTLLVAAGAGLCALAVASALPHRAGLWHQRRTVGGWRLAGGIAALAALGTLGDADPREYLAGLILTAALSSAALMLLVLGGAALRPAMAASLGTWLAGDHPRLPYLLAAWTVAISSLLAWTIFERVPHVPDEVAYWFQARYFASGALWAPAPPDGAAFDLPHTMVAGDRWFSIFPPGWPAALAIGMAAGAPWLVNPLLGGAAVLILHLLLRECCSHPAANLAAALLAASPMFLLMSAGLMSHPLALVCALGALTGASRTLAGGGAGPATAGGLALGSLVLTRPIEGVLVGLVIAGWSASRIVAGPLAARPVRRRLFGALAAFAAVSVAAGAVLLPYNRALTGRALYDPITKYFDERHYPGANRLGFGADVGNLGWQNDLRAGHGPVEAVVNAHRNTYLLSLELFGWPVGSLAGIVALLLFGRLERADAVFVALATAVVGGLGLYWYAGADYGARYWYLLLVPGVVLTARGIAALRDRLAVAMPAMEAAGRVAVAVGLACATALVVFLPWRALTKYRHYRGMSAGVIELTRSQDLAGALVFVRGAGPGTPFARYSAAAILNPIRRDDAGPVFARETDAATRRRIECAFAGRAVRTVDVSRLPGGPAILVDQPWRTACGPADEGGLTP